MFTWKAVLVSFTIALGLIWLAIMSGCSNEMTQEHQQPGRGGDGVSPDAGSVVQPDALLPDTKVIVQVDTRVPDTMKLDTMTSDTYVAQPDTLIQKDTQPLYTNTYGWIADPLTKGACCLPCSEYDGCVALVYTTPWCEITVGGNCYKGGLADGRIASGSVWSLCRPLMQNGACK